MSAQEEHIALVQTGGKSDPSTIEALFQALPTIKPTQLLGDWNHGGFFDTGHPVGAQLVEIKWIGKSFKSAEDVDPVIVDQDGKRTSWGKWGFASLREIVYEGSVSAAMIYDNRPIIDHFRYINDDFMAGVREGKALREAGKFYFYLRR